MSSLASIVTKDILRRGEDGPNVLALQLALSQAGYRVGQDGDFGPRTEQAVKQFQKQHGLNPDGIVGPVTATLLDQPHEELVSSAKPLTTNAAYSWPHDDTASLLAFYGKPWQDSSLLVGVPVPFRMTYRGDDNSLTLIKTIRFHKRAAEALEKALNMIAVAAKSDAGVLKHVSNLSGSYNYRPVRGSSRLSCHAFGAAIDFDAEALPLGKTGIAAKEMPAAVVEAFDSVGFFWGGRYTGRKDSMHFQAAHE